MFSMNYMIFICIIGFLPFIENQILLDLQLFDFINPKGLTNYTKKCDITSKCDPIFDICISNNSSKSCNILKKRTETFHNQNNILKVFSSKIPIKKLPEIFQVDVFVRDEDIMSKPDPINDFFTNSKPILNHLYLGFLTPKLFVKGVGFKYKYKFVCEAGYYGEKCELYCVENSLIDSCLLKRCKSKCVNGMCIVNKTNSTFSCNCYRDWFGETCSTKVSECDASFCNPTNLTCKKDYCSCQIANKTNSLCKKKLIKETESKKPSINLLNRPSNFYKFAAIPIVLALLGLVCFVSVTVWRHYYVIPMVSSPLFQADEVTDNEYIPCITYTKDFDNDGNYAPNLNYQDPKSLHYV